MLVMPPIRELLATGLVGAAAVSAAASARYLYMFLAPPLAVYDNERSILALVYALPALFLSLGSLVAAWSVRSRTMVIVRTLAWMVLLYVFAFALLHIVRAV